MTAILETVFIISYLAVPLGIGTLYHLWTT